MVTIDSRDEIFAAGHRAFVGGSDDFFWERIGQLQFDFLCANGLRPEHCLFDIACGSLRAGSKLIPYLDRGNYVGFDKYIELVILGTMHELGPALYAEKRPRFVIGDDFAFSSTETVPDYAIAQSLFTHLTQTDIRLCLTKLKSAAPRPLRFFATFFETAKREKPNPEKSHSHDMFYYSRAEMEQFGVESGFTPIYHGEWQHPRGQMMFEYRL